MIVDEKQSQTLHHFLDTTEEEEYIPSNTGPYIDSPPTPLPPSISDKKYKKYVKKQINLCISVIGETFHTYIQYSMHTKLNLNVDFYRGRKP